MNIRLIKRISLISSLTIFIMTVTTHAQTLERPLKEVRIVTNSKSLFVEGRTVIENVTYTGLDTDRSEYRIYSEDELSAPDLKFDLRNARLGYSEGEVFSAAKVSKTLYHIKEWLAERGFLKAEVRALGTPQKNGRMTLRFDVERGNPIFVSSIKFIGGRNVSNDELLANLLACSSRLMGTFKRLMFDHYTQRCSRDLLFARGFFRGRIERIVQNLRGSAFHVYIYVSEGRRYRWGDIKISGNRVISTERIKELLEITSGDVADAPKLRDFVYERLKNEYGELGYIHYDGEFDPEYVDPKDESSDGTVNISLLISEGPKYSVRKIEFSGGTDADHRQLQQDFALAPGETFNVKKFESEIERINKSGQFEFIDKDRDVEIRTDENMADIDLFIKLRKP